jgi:hypothetical protein
MMGKAILVLMLAVAGAATSAFGAQPPAEASIRCELSPYAVNPTDFTTYWARQYLSPVSPRPSEVKDTPKGLPQDSRYFVLNAAGRRIPLVMAFGQNPRSAVLYIDANGDGRLSDDKAYKCASMKAGSTSWTGFGPVTLQSGSADEKKTTVELGVVWAAENLLVAYPVNLRQGRFRLAGNDYKVAVIDGDLDGRYGRMFSVPESPVRRPECDFVMIDLNHDGKFPNWTYFQQSELMPLGKFVKLADSSYSVAVAADGTTLELWQAHPELGTLDLGGADIELKLWSDAGEQDLVGSEKQWRLPAGTYWAVAARLNQADSAGGKWVFSNYRQTGTLQNFQVRAKETTILKLGPPFRIKINAERNEDRTVSIGLLLEGQAGELYSLAVMRTAKSGTAAKPPAATRVAEPKFEIVSDAGKVLAAGQFEYG